jgi:hypothetical protein
MPITDAARLMIKNPNLYLKDRKVNKSSLNNKEVKPASSAEINGSINEVEKSINRDREDARAGNLSINRNHIENPDLNVEFSQSLEHLKQNIHEKQDGTPISYQILVSKPLQIAEKLINQAPAENQEDLAERLSLQIKKSLINNANKRIKILLDETNAETRPNKAKLASVLKPYVARTYIDLKPTKLKTSNFSHLHNFTADNELLQQLNQLISARTAALTEHILKVWDTSNPESAPAQIKENTENSIFKSLDIKK